VAPGLDAGTALYRYWDPAGQRRLEKHTGQLDAPGTTLGDAKGPNWAKY
jgi:hypothetical protein